MRYLGFSYDPHFHHLYRACDSRVFTTDYVTFGESDIQLPDYSGNLELELAGLQDISDDDKRVVDWEQLSLTRIDTDASTVNTTPPPTTNLPDATSDSFAAQSVGGKPGVPPDDADMTDESVFRPTLLSSLCLRH